MLTKVVCEEFYYREKCDVDESRVLCSTAGLDEPYSYSLIKG